MEFLGKIGAGKLTNECLADLTQSTKSGKVGVLHIKPYFYPFKMVIFHMILLDLPSFSIVHKTTRERYTELRMRMWSDTTSGSNLRSKQRAWSHEFWTTRIVASPWMWRVVRPSDLALPSTVKTVSFYSYHPGIVLIRQTYIQNNVCYDYYHHTIRHNHNATTLANLPIHNITQYYTTLHKSNNTNMALNKNTCYPLVT